MNREGLIDQEQVEVGRLASHGEPRAQLTDRMLSTTTVVPGELETETETETAA